MIKKIFKKNFSLQLILILLSFFAGYFFSFFIGGNINRFSNNYNYKENDLIKKAHYDAEILNSIPSLSAGESWEQYMQVGWKALGMREGTWAGGGWLLEPAKYPSANDYTRIYTAIKIETEFSTEYHWLLKNPLFNYTYEPFGGSYIPDYSNFDGFLRLIQEIGLGIKY